VSRLALGTAQFGLDYGIKNDTGKVPEIAVAKILQRARARDIDTLDTASAYGDSEAVLGRTMGSPSPFHVVSKLPSHPTGHPREELRASLDRLGLQSLYGYLLHSFQTWEQGPASLSELAACRGEGLVGKVGVSLYRPEEAERLMDAGAPLDLVQVPYSLLDRRFERIFERLHGYGAEIHVRSVFLQGVLFLDGERLHPRFARVRQGIEMLHAFARELDVDVAALCLGFVAANRLVTRIVVGVDSLRDLEVNLDSFEQGQRVSAALAALPDISTTDEGVILPFNWKVS
jgi:aryl-alcohol dehydrogenase-like predicted oxidoreductase